MRTPTVAPISPKPSCPQNGEQGMALLEALVALAIVALVVITFLGVRTQALVDATKARNWRLAREIAEEHMSELQAGAHETQPKSGEEIPIEKYPDFSYKIVIGEAGVSQIESEIAESAAGNDSTATERLNWQRDRDNFRKASESGLSYADYQDKLIQDEENRRLDEKAPSETDFEEVAVVVYFPKLNADVEGQRDSLIIKARVSTLAISGLTPDQAETVAAAKGQTPTSNSPGGSSANGGKSSNTGSGDK